MTEDRLGEKNFEAISKEIIRQYNLQLRFDNSHDTKIGIMFGFIMLVLAQITLNNELVSNVMKNSLSLGTFMVGLVIVLYSAYAGIRGYLTRKYNAGPKIPELIEGYRKNHKRDYNKAITSKIYEAFYKNLRISEKKVNYIKKMFITFIIGFIVIIISIGIGVAS